MPTPIAQSQASLLDEQLRLSLDEAYKDLAEKLADLYTRRLEAPPTRGEELRAEAERRAGVGELEEPAGPLEDIAKGLVFNANMGREVVQEAAVKVNDSLWPDGGGMHHVPLIRFVATWVLSAPPTRDQFASMSADERAIIRVLDERGGITETLRKFPGHPRKRDRMRAFVTANVNAGFLTFRQAEPLWDFFDGKNIRETDKSILDDAAEWLNDLAQPVEGYPEDKTRTRYNQFEREIVIGAVGANPKFANQLQSYMSANEEAIRGGETHVPLFGTTALKIRREEAAEEALGEYKLGNENVFVKEALLRAKINLSEESLAGLPKEHREAYKAALRDLVAKVQGITKQIYDNKDPSFSLEDKQEAVKQKTEELIGWEVSLGADGGPPSAQLTGVGFKRLASEMFDTQQQKRDEEARLDPKLAVEEYIASLGLDPADVSDRGKKTMRDDVRISGPSVLAGYPAEKVELFVREKSNEDFLAEGDDAIMGVLGRLGIGDAFNRPFQEHIQETVLPQLKPYLEEQFKRDPFFNREAFIGTLLGVAPLEPGAGFDLPQALLEPGAGFDLRGAAAPPGEAFIPPTAAPREAFIPPPGAAPDALARYKDDAARFPKPLISFDDTVYWDPEQYAAGVDPSQPPAPPPTLANVFESITRGQGGAFIPPGPLDIPVDGIPGQGTYPFGLQGAGGAPGEVFIPPLDHRGIVPREPTGFAPIPTQRRTSLGPAYGTTEGLEFTGLERPGEVPDVFPTFANTGFVQAAPLGFQFDPDIPLSPGQFRVDMPDLSQMAFDIAEGDPAYLRFLLAKESPFRLALGEFPEFAEEEAGRRETEANERLLALWEKGAAGLGTGRGREALFETMLDRRSPIEAAPFFEERAPGFRSAFEITPAFEEARLQKVETEEREMAAEQRRRLRRGRTVIV